MKIQNRKHMDTVSDNKSIFITIDEGEHKYRVVSDIHVVKEHNILIDGKRRFIACPTENARMLVENGEADQRVEIPPCPLCELGYPVKTSYLAIAVDRDNEEAGVMKKGTTLLGAIQALKDDEDWGDSNLYDIKVTAKGKDLARKYTVNGVPTTKSKPLTDKERSALDKLYESVDLEQMTVPRNYDEIRKIIGSEFPEHTDEVKQ